MSLPPPILGDSPQGFSDPLREKALSLKARLQSNENVPLDELISFITDASRDLSRTVKKITKKDTPTDVDFF